MAVPSMDDLLDRYPPPQDLTKESEPEVSRISPRRLPIEREIDLHGMTVEAAEEAMNRFVAEARAEGLQKVLFIHGKGSHEGSEGVLRAAVHRFIEQHPDVGASGPAPATRGGTGATWAIVRQRSR